jgi:hypothetical protein
VLVVVMLAMVMVVMVMVVKMTIEKRGLTECMQYKKFASFCNSILHSVTPAEHCGRKILFSPPPLW